MVVFDVWDNIPFDVGSTVNRTQLTPNNRVYGGIITKIINY